MELQATCNGMQLLRGDIWEREGEEVIVGEEARRGKSHCLFW